MRPSNVLILCLLWFFCYFLSPVYSDSSAPSDAPSLYEAGRTLQENGNLHGAIEMYRAALVKNPAYFNPMKGLAECFYLIGEYDEALRYVLLAEKYDWKNSSLYTMEGRIRIGRGEIEWARTLFDGVLMEEPHNLEARFGLAELDIAQGNLKNAATRYVETLKVSPESRKALISLAVLYDELGEHEIAERYLELALQYHANNPFVHYAVAKHLFVKKDYGTAEAHLITALSLKESYIDARIFLGEVYLAQERHQDTIQTMRRALLDQRDHVLAWYMLGLAYAKMGQVAEAVNSFSQALFSSYDDETARLALENLVLEELEIGNPERNRLAQYHARRGKTCEERNYLDKAFIEYRRALRLDPLSRDYRLAYASVYKILGFPAKYLSELLVLKNIGHQDTLILDEIEIQQSKMYDYVSTEWEFDQFALERDQFAVSLFNLTSENVEIHPQAGAVLTEFFLDLLFVYNDLAVDSHKTAVSSFEEGFRVARERNTDFFILVKFEESERSIVGTCTVYLTRSGSELASFNDVRTGNDRILNVLASLSIQLHGALPVRGKILKCSSEGCLSLLGIMHGQTTYTHHPESQNRIFIADNKILH